MLDAWRCEELRGSHSQVEVRGSPPKIETLTSQGYPHSGRLLHIAGLQLHDGHWHGLRTAAWVLNAGHRQEMFQISEAG